MSSPLLPRVRLSAGSKKSGTTSYSRTFTWMSAPDSMYSRPRSRRIQTAR